MQNEVAVQSFGFVKRATKHIYRGFIVAIGIALTVAGITTSSRADVLYVGDGSDNTVKGFDAATGTLTNSSNGIFVTAGNGGLHGPRGLIFNQSGGLEVANQDVSLTIPGAILTYDGTTGDFDAALVPFT